MRSSLLRRLALWAFAAFLVVAGTAHIISPGFFLAWMPPYWGAPAFWVLASGIGELLLAIALLVPVTRSLAGYAAVLMLALYLTVHIYAITDNEVNASGPYAIPVWTAWVRLFFQPVLMWWVWWASRPQPALKH